MWSSKNSFYSFFPLEKSYMPAFLINFFMILNGLSCRNGMGFGKNYARINNIFMFFGLSGQN